MKKSPSVGCGIILCKGRKVLIGLRSSEHGQDTWGFPGGKLEFGETVEECVRRELFEETGLKAGKLTFLHVTDDIFPDKLHYITIFLVGEWRRGVPRVKEPEKCEAWEWHSWNRLPRPHFLPLKNLLEAGKNPFRF